MKKALITGATGQGDVHLAELHARKQIDVRGLVPHFSKPSAEHLEHSCAFQDLRTIVLTRVAVTWRGSCLTPCCAVLGLTRSHRLARQSLAMQSPVLQSHARSFVQQA